MTKKTFFVKFAWIAGIILAIFLYLFFYIIPSLFEIGQGERILSEMKMKIENFKEIQKSFPFPDAKENQFFKDADGLLQKRFPAVTSKADLNSLLARVSDYLRKRARADGIIDLRINDNRVQMNNSGGVIPVNLSFSGSFKSVLNFIDHLPWGEYYVIPADIRVVHSGNSVYYSIVLNVYTAEGKSEMNGIQDQDIMIDFESPVLLQRVYENPIEAYTRRELPSKYGTGIFANPRLPKL